MCVRACVCVHACVCVRERERRNVWHTHTPLKNNTQDTSFQLLVINGTVVYESGRGRVTLDSKSLEFDLMRQPCATGVRRDNCWSDSYWTGVASTGVRSDSHWSDTWQLLEWRYHWRDRNWSEARPPGPPYRVKLHVLSLTFHNGLTDRLTDKSVLIYYSYYDSDTKANSAEGFAPKVLHCSNNIIVITVQTKTPIKNKLFSSTCIKYCFYVYNYVVL